MQRIGVFVCHCGTNIAGTVDVKAVAEALGREPSVVTSVDYQYMCSESGQNLIKDAIRDYRLTASLYVPARRECTKTRSARQRQPRD